MYTNYMADTSLNEDRLGLLVWQTSNFWQSNLRKIIKIHQISLNEYFIIETIFKLSPLIQHISQITISKNACLDVSVVSSNLIFLEKKKIITKFKIDNRTNGISLTNKGISLIKSIIDTITNEEIVFFNKLGNETFNFKNSLKLLLGKKIRIKAKNE